MKKKSGIVLIPVILGFIFMYLGIMWTPQLIEYMLPKNGGATYQGEAHESFFLVILSFSFAIAMIPLLLWFTWKQAHVVSISQKFFSVLIILACAVVALAARRFMIRAAIKNLAIRNNIDGIQYNSSFPIDRLYFEYYLWGGIIAGCLLSYFMFKKKKTAE